MEPVTPADREEFLAMAERHFRELNPDFIPHDDWKRGFFDTVLSRPTMFARWITHEGKRVGFILYGLKDDPILPRRYGMIFELYVVSDFRRMGLAKQTAVEAIKELQTYSPAKIQLEIMDGNDGATGLWKSLGFEKISDRYVRYTST